MSRGGSPVVGTHGEGRWTAFTPSPRLRGEGGVRGSLHGDGRSWIRGESPSPAAPCASASPRARGEAKESVPRLPRLRKLSYLGLASAFLRVLYKGLAFAAAAVSQRHQGIRGG